MAARTLMIKQRRSAANCQPVGRVSRGVDAKRCGRQRQITGIAARRIEILQVVIVAQSAQRAVARHSTRGQWYPSGAIENEGNVFICDPGDPAFDRSIEDPARVLIRCDPPRLSGPCTRGGDIHDIAGAFKRERWRGGEIAIQNRKLHHAIQRAHGFVVGDVLLLLSSQYVRQLQVGRLIHYPSSSRNLNTRAENAATESNGDKFAWLRAPDCGTACGLNRGAN